MSRKYTKVAKLSEEVFRRKATGETNREIVESYGLSLQQIKALIKRQNRKARQEYHFRLSMSSPGCAYDNAGKFLCTLKTECLYRSKFAGQNEMQLAVAAYVQFYNFERIDLKNGLTPFEIRSKAL